MLGSFLQPVARPERSRVTGFSFTEKAENQKKENHTYNDDLLTAGTLRGATDENTRAWPVNKT